MDGRLTRGNPAAFSRLDRRVHGGEGLFETLRVESRVPQLWDRHLERLVHSAAVLGFPVPPAPELLRAAVDQVLEASDLDDAAVRITLTRAGRGRTQGEAGCWIEAEPLAARLWSGGQGGAAKVVFSRQPFEPGPLARHKTTSRLAYQSARDEAHAAGAHEALMVSKAEQVLEGSVSNLFAVFAGVVLTPPLEAGILPGITRARVLGLCERLGLPAREGGIARRELLKAEEAFVTNAIQGVVPIGTLEGRGMPGAAIGERVRVAYRASLMSEVPSMRQD